MSYHPVYRGGKVHVLAEKCASCIFRSVNDGRIKGLAPGRVAGMVVEARNNESVIPCHLTIYTDEVKPAVCRGYFDLPIKPAALQIAERLNLIEWDTPPEEEMPR